MDQKTTPFQSYYADFKNSFRGRLDSCSTASASFGSQGSQFNNLETNYRHQSNLQVIDEHPQELEKTPSSSAISNQLTGSFKSSPNSNNNLPNSQQSQQKSLSSSEGKQYEQDKKDQSNQSFEEIKLSPSHQRAKTCDVHDIFQFESSFKYVEQNVHLKGKFVIGIKDSQHLQMIKQNQCHLLFSLIRNYCPVIYLSDIELNKLTSLIPIIPDYYQFSCDSLLNGSYQNDALSFNLIKEQQSIKNRFNSFSIGNLEQSDTFKKIDDLYFSPDHPRTKLSKKAQSYTFPQQSPIKVIPIIKERAKSYQFRRKKKEIQKNPDEEIKKIIANYNLDQIQSLDDSVSESSSSTPQKSEPLLLKGHTKEIEYYPSDSQVLFKNCCSDNFSSCSHRSKIAWITLKELIHISFTTEHGYYFIILVSTYQKIVNNQCEFFSAIIKLYQQEKQNQKSCKQIISNIQLWIDYRYNELIDEQSKLSGEMHYFLSIAELLNFKYNLELNNQIEELTEQIEKLHEVRKQRRKTSFIESQSKIPQFSRRYSEQIQQCRQNTLYKSQQLRQENSIIHPYDNLLVFKNIDWTMYIEAPAQILQRQLWIVDVQLFSKIKINNLFPKLREPLIQNNILQQVSQHFDLLLYHMLFTTITCPKALLPILFTKLLNISILSIQAQHYQLSYLLYTFFTHDLTKYYLDPQSQLSVISLQELNDLINFGSKKHHYFNRNALDINQSHGQIPCMSWILSAISRLEVNEQIWKDKKFVNFEYLEQIAQLTFPILHMQSKYNRMEEQELQKFVEQPYFDFFKGQYKDQLRKNLNYNSEKTIEIELYKLKEKLKQKE